MKKSPNGFNVWDPAATAAETARPPPALGEKGAHGTRAHGAAVAGPGTDVPARVAVVIPPRIAGIVRRIGSRLPLPGQVETIGRSVDKASGMVGGRVECPHIAIDRRRRCIARRFCQDHTPAVIWFVEIRIVPAIPHEVTIPAKIRIPETEPDAHSRIAVEMPVPISGIAITVTNTHSDRRGGIIGIVAIVIIEGRPARLIRRFHLHIIVAGRRAVIFAPLAGGLSSLSEKRNNRQGSAQASSSSCGHYNQGKYGSHGERFYLFSDGSR